MTDRAPRAPRPGVEPDPVVGSLCTGYGGLDLGVLAAFGGGRIAWVADPDPHIALVLAARLPHVPNLGDLRHVDWTAVEPVDVLTAGFPCQDISAAGRRAGIEKGTRSGLWTDIVEGLRLLRPALVVLENVAALRWRGGGLHRVLGDLAEAGYDAAWRSVRAADIGVAHRRERLFLLAWPRPPRPGRSDNDTVGAGCVRRLLRLHPRRGKAQHPVTAAAAAVVDANGLGREELHPPHPQRWSVTTGPATAAADPAGLGHRNRRTQGRARLPTTAVTASPSTGTPECRGVVADTARHRRNEGMPGAAGLQGRPDADIGNHPTAHIDHGSDSRDHLVTTPERPSTSVNWGVYQGAIRRWKAVLGRPVPRPTQRGNHGRPVLAPAFVEHLMGLPEGWVTGLELPRTAQLRALGNGVIPQQATHAVSLLLDDLTALLRTDRRFQTGRKVAAA